MIYSTKLHGLTMEQIYQTIVTIPVGRNFVCQVGVDKFRNVSNHRSTRQTFSFTRRIAVVISINPSHFLHTGVIFLRDRNMSRLIAKTYDPIVITFAKVQEREKECVTKRKVIDRKTILEESIRQHNSNNHLCTCDVPPSTIFASRANLRQSRFNEFHRVSLYCIKGRLRGTRVYLNSSSHATDY